MTKLPSLIVIQEEFIRSINIAHLRWKHREGFEWQKDKIGGHYGRTYRGAQNRAMRQLAKWGFTREQSMEIVKQAHEVAVLQREAEDD